MIEEEVSIDGLAKKYPPVETQAPDEGTAGSKDVFEGGAPSCTSLDLKNQQQEIKLEVKYCNVIIEQNNSIDYCHILLLPHFPIASLSTALLHHCLIVPVPHLTIPPCHFLRASPYPTCPLPVASLLHCLSFSLLHCLSHCLTVNSLTVSLPHSQLPPSPAA